MDSGLFSSGDREPPPALRAGESSQTRSGVGGVPGRLGAVSAHRVAQHIAAAPDGLDVVVAAGRVGQLQIGRASCRARVCQYVLISVGAGSLKKKQMKMTYLA